MSTDLFRYKQSNQRFRFYQATHNRYFLEDESTQDAQSFVDWATFADHFFANVEWFRVVPDFIHPLIARFFLTYINIYKRSAYRQMTQQDAKLLYAWERMIYADGANVPQQFCANCGAEVKYNPRYPLSICKTCISELSDTQGRKVAFSNTGVMGTGCRGYYADDQTPYEGSVSYIGQVPFRASEHRFGGIVVERES